MDYLIFWQSQLWWSARYALCVVARAHFDGYLEFCMKRMCHIELDGGIIDASVAPVWMSFPIDVQRGTMVPILLTHIRMFELRALSCYRHTSFQVLDCNVEKMVWL
jgi:hypothetical protein